MLAGVLDVKLWRVLPEGGVIRQVFLAAIRRPYELGVLVLLGEKERLLLLLHLVDGLEVGEPRLGAL